MSDENAAQGETPDLDLPETETAEVEPVEALQAENAELKDRVLRTVAEMENLRKRTETADLRGRVPVQEDGIWRQEPRYTFDGMDFEVTN